MALVRSFRQVIDNPNKVHSFLDKNNASANFKEGAIVAGTEFVFFERVVGKNLLETLGAGYVTEGGNVDYREDVRIDLFDSTGTPVQITGVVSHRVFDNFGQNSRYIAEFRSEDLEDGLALTYGLGSIPPQQVVWAEEDDILRLYINADSSATLETDNSTYKIAYTYVRLVNSFRS